MLNILMNILTPRMIMITILVLIRTVSLFQVCTSFMFCEHNWSAHFKIGRILMDYKGWLVLNRLSL